LHLIVVARPLNVAPPGVPTAKQTNSHVKFGVMRMDRFYFVLSVLLLSFFSEGGGSLLAA
jgi:hypothetical protein